MEDEYQVDEEASTPLMSDSGRVPIFVAGKPKEKFNPNVDFDSTV